MVNNLGRNSTRAFTIWELLCVVSIIALLMALLLPSLHSARSRSTSIICSCTLKQYGIAGIMYLSDNDDTCPDPNEWLFTRKSYRPDHPRGCRWHDQVFSPHGEIMRTSPEYQGKLWHYFGDGTIYPCPIFRDLDRSKICENPNHIRSIDVKPQYNYTMNGYLGTERHGGVVKASQVRDPATVFYFAEENSWSVRPNHPTFPARWLYSPLSTKALDDTALFISPSSPARNCFATYHSPPSGDLNRGSGNVVFIDGHVQSIDAEDQLRDGESYLGPAGNLNWAWPGKLPPPGGWD